MPAPGNPMKMAQLSRRRFGSLISLIQTLDKKKKRKKRKKKNLSNLFVWWNVGWSRFQFRVEKTSLEKSTTREGRSLDVVYKGAPDIKHLLMRESGLDRVCNNGFFASLIVQNVCLFRGSGNERPWQRAVAARQRGGGQEACIGSGNNSWKRMISLSEN